MFTYGGSSGTAFSLNAAVAAVYQNANVQGYEIVLRSYLSKASVSRSMTSEAAFVQESKAIVDNMLKSFVRRLEIGMMYGQSGIGKVEGSETAASNVVIEITDAEWAPGIWAGAEGMPIDIYNSTTFVLSTEVESVNLDNKTITCDITANLSAGYDIYFGGAYGNEMAGLHKIISNTGSLFGINAGTYNLFQGSTVSAASGTLSLSLVEKGIARALEKGLDEEDLLLICNPLTWKDLLNEQDAKRRLDSSYSSKLAQAGSKKLEFFGPNGVIEIVSSIFCKEGYAYLIPVSEFERIGSTDITFDGMDGKFIKLLENASGYELRAYSDQALFTTRPGLCVLFNNIVNA